MVKAIADLVAAVAWPGVVLILAYMFRDQVAKFINDAKLLKFGAMSAERQVREEVDRSGKEAEAAEGRSDGPTSNELVRAGVVERLAENSDSAVIRGQARELGEEYERVRGSLPSGDDRTRAMEVVVSKMRTIGRAVIPVRYDLSASNSPGERLAAIASLQVALDYDFIPWLTDRAESPSQKSHAGLLNFLSIRRMDASLMKATAIAVRFSKSLARRRHRLSHARVLSTTHRRGKTSNPLALSDRFTIVMESPGNAFANASRNFGP